MNAFEANKIIGGLLMTVLITLLIGHVGDFLVSPHRLEKPAYMVESGLATGEHAPVEAAPPAVEAVTPLLAAASAEAGRAVFRQCQSCHTVDKGGRAAVGPNLWDIVGNRKAHASGFAYSPALQAESHKSGEDAEWTYEQLNHFLANPRAALPGTKMSFAGLRRLEDRANVIAFLRGQSDSPKPLP